MAVDAAASNRADRVSAAVGHASLTFRQDHSMGASHERVLGGAGGRGAAGFRHGQNDNRGDGRDHAAPR